MSSALKSTASAITHWPSINNLTRKSKHNTKSKPTSSKLTTTTTTTTSVPAQRSQQPSSTSTPPAITITTHGHTFAAHAARATTQTSSSKDSNSKPWIRRIQTYTSNALLLFNVYGIPLSSGVYIEYFYNTLLPDTSFSAITLIPGIQVLCVCAMQVPVSWLYSRLERKWKDGENEKKGDIWCRSVLGIASTVVVACQAILPFCKSFAMVLLVWGTLMGIALGVLRGVGLVVLASHYKTNVTLVSMQGVGMGFIGAGVYTFVAWGFLSANEVEKGFISTGMVNAGIAGITLLIAVLLSRRSSVYHSEREHSHDTKNIDTYTPPPKIPKIVFLTGLLLTLLTTPILPLYIPTILSLPPALLYPHQTHHILLTTFLSASLSSSFAAQPRTRDRVGPVNSFIAASLLSGLCYLHLVFARGYWSFIVSGGVYGVTLGVTLALYAKALSVFGWRRQQIQTETLFGFRRDAVCLVLLLGFAPFLGIFGAGVVLQKVRDGVRVVMGTAGTCVLLGGVLMGGGRWGLCKGVWVVV